MKNLEQELSYLKVIEDSVIPTFKAQKDQDRVGLFEKEAQKLRNKIEMMENALVAGAEAGLNNNETYVLLAIVEAHIIAGGDFCYFDEVAEELKELLKENQVKGYVSKLQQKGFITVGEESKQINMLEKSSEVIEGLGDSVTLY